MVLKEKQMAAPTLVSWEPHGVGKVPQGVDQEAEPSCASDISGFAESCHSSRVDEPQWEMLLVKENNGPGDCDF